MKRFKTKFMLNMNFADWQKIDYRDRSLGAVSSSPASEVALLHRNGNIRVAASDLGT